MSPLPAVRRPPPAHVVRFVYLSTPLFAALDFAYGISLRIPALDAVPGAKAAYYAVDVACAIALWLRPRWTAAIGLGESALNISLLVISTWASYLSVLDSAGSPAATVANPFTPEAVTGLVISASVLAASYLTSSSALEAARPYRCAPGEAS